MMDDLTHIFTFCRTVETGSVTEAAKSLHLTKSVASRRLSTLEANLGVSLLKRSPRGAVATEAGELYYERARRILDSLEDARQEVSGLGSDLVGRMRVTTPRGVGDLLLNQAFASFMANNPSVELEIHQSDRTVDMISDGYDLGVRIGALKDSSLIAKKLTEMHIAAVASPEYLQAHGTPQSPDDLKEHACIFYANVEARSQWRFQAADGSIKSVKVHGRVTTNSGEMQAEAAKAGVGIALLPLFYVDADIADGSLIQILSDYTQQTVGVYALFPPSRQQSAKVRALVDHLAAFCKSDAIQCCL